VTTSLTTADDARQFVNETHVDTLAPAVGNMHGLFKSMVDGGVKKRLDLDRIRDIKAARGCRFMKKVVDARLAWLTQPAESVSKVTGGPRYD